MPEWLFTRPAVITLAILGGGCALIASALKKRDSAPQWAARFNTASYGFMGVSVLCFIIAGLRGSQS